MDATQTGVPNIVPKKKDRRDHSEQTQKVGLGEPAVHWSMPEQEERQGEDGLQQLMDKADTVPCPIIVLLYCIVVILVAANMPLRWAKPLDGLLTWLPLPGQQQVVARRNLGKDRQFTLDDLDTVWSLHRLDVFTDTHQLVHAYTTEVISEGQPILHAQVARYQVVAKERLEANYQITADDLGLTLTSCRTEAYTDKEEVVGLYTRQPISKSLTILDSVVDPKYVVAKWYLDVNQPIAETDLELAFLDKGEDDYFTDIAQIVGLYTKQPITASMPIRERQVSFVQLKSRTALETGHLITKTDLITEPLDYYTDTVFTKPSQIDDYYTLTRVERNKPILKSQVEPCQAIAARPMPAYHLIEAAIDVTVEEVCEPIRGRITGEWEGHYTRKPIEAGAAIQDADLVPGVAPQTDTVAIPFVVPLANAFGGNLKAGDVVNISLVQRSEAAAPTTVLTITKCLLLSVEGLAPGQAVEGQASGEETPPPEPKTLIVAAIPKADEQKFIRWLPFSQVILSVATGR